MDRRLISFNQQLESAASLAAECENYRSQLAQIQTELTDQEEQRDEDLANLKQASDAGLQSEVEQLKTQADNQRATFELDQKTQTESFRDSTHQTIRQLELKRDEDLIQLEDRRKSETWILQSVLDEDNDDTPVTHFDREAESYATQKIALEERTETLSQKIDETQLLLASCHTNADKELPPPAIEKAGRDGLRDKAIEAGDRLLVESQTIERMHSPAWIKGFRLFRFGAVAFVALWLPIIAIRADLRQFLSPETSNPNLEWAAVSALIALSVVFLAGLILLLNVQGKLRSRFQSMLQSYADCRHAQQFWEQKSDKYIDRLETAATQWRQQVEERREQQLHRIQTEIDNRIETARTETESQTTRLQQELDNKVQQLTATRTEMDNHVTSRLNADTQEAEIRYAAALDSAEQERNRHFNSATTELKTNASQLLQNWTSSIDSIRNITLNATNFAASTIRWPTADAADWKLPEAMPDCISVGDILVTAPKAPESVQQTDDTNLCEEMPAVLQFPTDTSILIEHDSSGRKAALSFLRTQILKLLTVIPAGRIRLTLIDPVGLGQSFAAMMHLADFDELLIHSRIWTDSSQIRGQLQKITEHMENIFQTYLRSQFDTIEEYNESAGEVAEPYHFVVVAGFPTAFTEESARHLSSILTSGPRCGVHTLIAWNPAVTAPTSFDIEDMTNNCIRFQVADGIVQPQRAVSQHVKFEQFHEPAAEQYVQLVRDAGEQSKNARRVEVSFNRISPRSEELWSHSSAEGIDLPIGRAGAARLQYMRLGRGTSQHVLVAGKTGSGKSTFLHILITNLALHYSPDELQFYLIDFKKGVEFRTYAVNQLPHAKVVAIESEREFGLSVLERLDELLQERGELFRECGVQDVPSYRREFPGQPMPRLLLLIDEFQEFFVAEDRISSRASLLLDRLVRQGRAFGIHVLLGSQTLGGAYSLARSTMGQIAVRVALQCSEGDAHLILSEDNMAARLLTRPGEAIYNDANGLVQGNHQFQVAWLTEDEREAAIQSMPKAANGKPHRPHGLVVFEGNVAPTAELCSPLNVHLVDADDATRKPTDAMTIWLGEPVAIAGPTCVELRRASGQNVLIVGQDERQVDSLLAFVAVSTCGKTNASRPTDNSGPRLTLLHDGRDEESLARFTHLKSLAGAGDFDIFDSKECDTAIERIFSQIEAREQNADLTTGPEHVFIVRNTGQFRSIRKDEDDFGLGSFGEKKSLNTADRFSEIVKRGPIVGIHVVVWADTFNNAVRWLSNSLLREFENRIAFRMNQTDSASLVDSPVAASLTQGRALVYRDQTGTVEKFRPFAWPSDQWLSNVVFSNSDDLHNDFDIDSMMIE